MKTFAEFHEFDEGVALKVARVIDRTNPPIGRPSIRRKMSHALKMKEIDDTAKRNSKKKYSGNAAADVKESTFKEEKVKCPECGGKKGGCDHCDGKGYHIKESAWQRKEGKNPSGGLNEKGRKSYERENPGSDLKAPQPEGGPRKRSFCARMGGMKGPMKDENGKPTRKALALRKWKC
tara:strand:- start:2380 stop:2913 length:534 start_codon:yes stop_codon:yes gene_type:complete